MLNRIQNDSEGTHRGGLNRHDYAQRATREVASQTVTPADNIRVWAGDDTHAEANIYSQPSSPISRYHDNDDNRYGFIFHHDIGEESPPSLTDRPISDSKFTTLARPSDEELRRIYHPNAPRKDAQSSNAQALSAFDLVLDKRPANPATPNDRRGGLTRMFQAARLLHSPEKKPAG